MLAAVRSAAVLGIEAYDVTVEVDAARGLPQWTIVGLPAGAVRESRERVGAALANSGFEVPPRRMTVNLAPADIRKEGTAFDLPIALAMLAATGQLDPGLVDPLVAIGELGLDGSLRAVRGALPVARHAVRTRAGWLVLPPANVAEASLVSAARLAAPATLAELVATLRNGGLRLAMAPERRDPRDPAGADDFAEVIGQALAKRALEIAAAGAHNALLIGPPGAGKTMLARRLPGILPALTEEEALEVTAVHSVAGLLPPGEAMVSTRPFRAPHHSVSEAGLVGGGSVPHPGEASLAHLGVLFLDELLEFPRRVLDALRQPMEDGRVIIARATSAVMFPARFVLVAAMNPCPCGFAGSRDRPCICAAAAIEHYRSRLSGPMADRIDLHVTLGAVPLAELAERPTSAAECSQAIRARVERARTRQRARYAALGDAASNGGVPARWISERGAFTGAARALAATAAAHLKLSARGFHRVLRVARTIADLDDDAPRVEERHVAESIGYRPAQHDPQNREPADRW